MKYPLHIFVIKIKLLVLFSHAKHSLDVLYQALSQCDLSDPCSTFHNHLFKVNQSFLPLIEPIL
jgi:hypothetical protein